MTTKTTMLLLALAVLPFQAFGAGDSESTLRQAMQEAVTAANASPGGRALADKLQPILERRVCFESMTRRAIGPGWREFSPAQQTEATRLFTKLIIRSYSSKFTPGEEPEVKYLKGSPQGPDKIEIPTSMIYNGSRYSIVYRMENRGKWLITDILVEGVSLIANYRAQFNELFKRGGVNAVMDSLKKSVTDT